jgi:hypothetical protein
MKHWLAGVVLVTGLGLVIALGAQGDRVRSAPPDNLPTPTQLMAEIPKHLGHQVPYDVDIPLKTQLDSAKKFAEVQLLFDILSWESFVAVCWPVGPDGKPLAKLADDGKPSFTLWRTDEDVFAGGAAGPLAWGEKRVSRLFADKGVPAGERVVRLLSSVGGDLNARQDVAQAFSYPLWDQNGNMVRYEIFLNSEEFEYLERNKLYTIAGQVEFSEKNNAVQFPSGDAAKKKVGAVDLKLAWKVLGKDDLPERFLVTEAYILTGADSKPTKAKLGLVGMHISHKTVSSPQWIWSTFMHVDNLQTNALETVDGKPLRPLFDNPGCETCPANQPATKTPPYEDGRTPTQVLQLVPIPKATQELNRFVQGVLREQGSVLRHYELLNTQWPTDPSARPTPGGPGTAPGSITNKSGGKPTPVYLTNPVLETYFQAGNQKASQQEEGKVTDDQIVFGTESCTGCHSSAPVAVGFKVVNGKKVPQWGGQLSGDFSWLLRTKAK